MALDVTGPSEGVLIGGPVTATKNQSVLFGMAWVLFRAFPATDTKICDYTINVGNNSRFTIQYDNLTPGFIFVGGRATDAEGIKIVQSPTSLELSRWTHVACMLDYENSIGAVWYDAELQISAPVTGAPFAAAQTANTNSANGGIGTRPNATQGMSGLIDDFRLYNRRLGESELKTIVAGKGKDAIVDGLLHRYPLNDAGPPTPVVSCACIASAERIVATAIGAPMFGAGITVARQRTQAPIGARR